METEKHSSLMKAENSNAHLFPLTAYEEALILSALNALISTLIELSIQI